MTTIVSPPHSVSAFPPNLQTVTIQRRLGVSPPLARALSDLVYGPDRRDDVLMVSATTAARVASYTGACS